MRKKIDFLESDERFASSEVRPTYTSELRCKIDISSEVSWYSLEEWHLPEVMMNYLESDGRVASSEVRPACSHELRQQKNRYIP